jgi:hypothetical protein
MNIIEEGQPHFSFNDGSDSEMGINDASSPREQVIPDQLPLMTAPVNCHIKRASKAHNRNRKGKGHDPPFILNERALADIHQLQALWLTSNDRVPPAVWQDKKMWKLNVINMDMNLWLKAMAPSDKKEFCRFCDLVYEIILPPDDRLSPLEGRYLVTPLGNTLRELVYY